MGGYLSKLINKLQSISKTNQQYKIIIVGMNNAGKTTILRALSQEDITQIMPTQGFNIKSLVSVKQITEYTTLITIECHSLL